MKLSAAQILCAATLAVAICGCSSRPTHTAATSAASAGAQPAKRVVQPSNRPIAAQTVPLQFVEQQSFECYYRVSKGKIGYPFPNAAGKLTIEVRDGKVYGDTNGDGVIDAKDAPPVEPTKGTLKFAMNLPGRVIDFPVIIGELRTFGGDDQEVRLCLTPGGAFQADVGDWTILYKASTFRRDLESFFSNVAIIPAGSDPRYASTASLSRTYEIADRLYTVNRSDDLKQLSIAPYTGPIATVRVTYALPEDAAPVDPAYPSQQDNSSVYLTHTQDIQQASVTARHSSRFVPGPYRIQSVFLSRFIKSGQAYVSGSMDPKAPPVTLKPGDNEIHFGAPFKMDFVATRKDDTIELTDVAVTGRLGEHYYPPGQGGETLFAAYLRSGGKEQPLAKLEYG